ncbi:hypothetical protein H0H92_005686 [Tricholoma furcatifolium]|nr:hypothetical protein H0H92_005686 [Tricholoma furcatifolium]
MSQAHATDLKQVSAIFNACIAQIRSKPAEDLDKFAEKWLKDARVHVMQRIQSEFNDLVNTASDPERLKPDWAVNPECPLSIWTPYYPKIFRSYAPRFKAEFESLMDLCGFTANVSAWDSIIINIYFPANGEVPLEHFTSQINKCFDTLPKFSAAILRISEGIEEHVTSTPPTTSRVVAGRVLRSSKKKEATYTMHYKGPSRLKKTPKYRRTSAAAADEPVNENPDGLTQRRSKRLRCR